MPDIDSMIDHVVPAVEAAVVAYGTGVLSRAGDEAEDATVRLGQRFLTRLLHRSAPSAPLELAVKDLADASGDPDALAQLRLQIKKVLNSDPDLLAEIAESLPKRRPTSQTRGARSPIINGENSGIISLGDEATNFQLR